MSWEVSSEKIVKGIRHIRKGGRVETQKEAAGRVELLGWRRIGLDCAASFRFPP